jgi:SAM-dependent methyltransferase
LSTPDVRDRWAAGATYEDFMGRWSRRLAPHFVSWLRAPGGANWLDVGCGTGALTQAICDHAAPASILGCDPAEAFVAYARANCRDARASFTAAGAGALPPRAGGYGCIASLLALNFFPDAEAAIREMRSLMSPGGAVSACVWDYAGRMDLLRIFWDAAVALDTNARELDEGIRFPFCRPDALIAAFRAGGLTEVRCEPIEIPTELTSFEDYWRPFLGGTGPAPSYVASLDADRRAALARGIEQRLPRGSAGTIPLTARAWAVCGIAP